MVIDPVCKMKIDEKTAKFKSDYQEKTYYFCAPGCKRHLIIIRKNTLRR
jgi:YHS domain-containing protein